MSNLSFEAKLKKNRNLFEKVSDDVVRFAGSFSFFFLNLVFFATWIILNSGHIAGLIPFDPFPFILLTMTVSLEAIILSLFVLMSQNRQSNVDSLREEIHLQVNEIAEREITKCLQLLNDLHQAKFPKRESDPQLERMLKNTNTEALAIKLGKELEPPPLAIAELFEKFSANRNKK